MKRLSGRVGSNIRAGHTSIQPPASLGWGFSRALINQTVVLGIGKQSVISSLAGTDMHSPVVCSLSEVDINF
jgi:hypothetical protein